MSAVCIGENANRKPSCSVRKPDLGKGLPISDNSRYNKVMKFDTTTTICAIATGNSPAMRGAIRVSGTRTMEIVGRALGWVPADTTTMPHRVLIDIEIPSLGRIDAQLLVWPTERSYTGQPSAEIHTIGSQIVLQSIQSMLIHAGARLAFPGEYTLRSFLAGRLDLMQCEAVLGVIHASNEHALKVALSQLAGGLSTPLSTLRTTLIHLLADIEAGLDFVDEDIQFIAPQEILRQLNACSLGVQQMLAQMEDRRGQEVAWTIAIVGKPNSGKSSLLNAIAKREVAIVSPEPGTTRDYIRLRLQLGNIVVDLIDTAGLEALEEDTPRHRAQGMTRAQLDDAHLILRCVPVDEAMGEVSHSMPEREWIVRTKLDLLADPGSIPSDAIGVSALKGTNLDRLLDALTTWGADRAAKVGDVVPMTAVRCRESLLGAQSAIAEAALSVQERRGDEVTASELRIALDELGTVAGTVYTEDILDALFSRFCIGK